MTKLAMVWIISNGRRWMDDMDVELSFSSPFCSSILSKKKAPLSFFPFFVFYDDLLMCAMSSVYMSFFAQEINDGNNVMRTCCRARRLNIDNDAWQR